MCEGRTIQAHLQTVARNTAELNAHVFAKLMFEGKTHTVLQYLSKNSSNGMLD